MRILDINPVEMDRVSGVSPQNPKQRIEEAAAPGERGPGSARNGAAGQEGDSFEADGLRLSLRELIDSGDAETHVEDIVASGVEPDYLRAELALRAAQGDGEAVSILIRYLAGYFKEGAARIALLQNTQDPEKIAEFLFLQDYLSGRPEEAMALARSLGDAALLSPFFNYAYADLLLSYGYVDESRALFRRYTSLARRYLPNFVTEREKYGAERRRRARRGQQGDQNPGGAYGRGDGNPQQGGGNPQQDGRGAGSQDAGGRETPGGNPGANTIVRLAELTRRRRVLMEALRLRNVGFDKRPLLYELEDVDTHIAALTGTPAAEAEPKILR